PGLVGLSAMEPKGYARMLVSLSGSLLVKLVATLFVIALIDLVYTRWEFGKRMRMSKRDVRDEAKNREGDPRIRSRIRELRQEMLKRSKSMAKLPSADVLIANPTHLAVALSYQHGVGGAPQVIAKGAGDLARQMRQLAAKHQIPVVQNRLLARALYREVDYDGYVPEKWYPQVAKIMVWVYAMRRARNTKGS
ncbi:MAG TPA: EscU/YscU/HrcU family type III secretion system export apparatus switch protein, partial [Telluria sp.]|nr:EscU/YscU/HrcU family type III secretion system export apparatus switch protein [Telluria sp.]